MKIEIKDKANCCGCEACKNICPLITEPDKEVLSEVECYAAYNKKSEILKTSSSGGIFWLVSEWIFNQNEIVYGVVQNICKQK